MTDQQYPNWVFKRPQWLKALIGPGKPIYRLPYRLLASIAYDALRARPRCVWDDAAELVAHVPGTPRVEGAERIPTSGSCVILPNHYERQDAVWVGFGAAVVATALAERRPGAPGIRWVITSTWQDCYLGPRRVDPRRLEGILKRFAQLYGLILMPADEADTAGRGVALRALFKALAKPDQLIALHPEAGGFQEMIQPPAGIGRVLSLIDRRGVPLLPVGVWEEPGGLRVRFGQPLPQGAIAHLGDAEATSVVMRHIAQLVPPANRGVFAPACDNEVLSTAPALAAVGDGHDR